MSDTVADNYASYYADKLWNLLPAVYRALDTDQFGANGPLREMVNRIGATTATVRRNIDRLWENQSIEACDDWAIPYIGDLLGTRLVLGLDPRGQRLDVANTIDYRRRKGTLAVLEQIAFEITRTDTAGWDVKVVEFFRRLGRTRHSLDPQVGPIGLPGSDLSRLHQAEGIFGSLTHTPIGGFANLRNVYGAGKSRSAYDEFFHTADTRTGQGDFGWHAIPHLGAFVWRLVSLGVGPVTPVPVSGCPGWYCWDPTGRDIPLFGVQRSASAFGDAWVSPTEGQLPTPISQALLDADIKLSANGLGLYPVVPAPAAPMPLPALSVQDGGSAGTILPAARLTLRPEYGRFRYAASPPLTDPVVSYHYGFSSLIGAGPYDRRGQAITVPTPDPSTTRSGGGTILTQTASVLPPTGTVTFNDSLTYAGAADVHVRGSLTLMAAIKKRPLIRLDAGTPWTFEGTSTDASLVLDGMFVSGQDIVLQGNFATVTLTCCTLDPGSAAAQSALAKPTGSPPPVRVFQAAADLRELRPTRLWIDGTITTLTIDRCVLGPIRTRGSGSVETTTISNTIVQGIRSSELDQITLDEVKDPARLLRELQLGLDPVSMLLRALEPGIGTLLGPLASPPVTASSPPSADLGPLLTLVNKLAGGRSIYQTAAFAGVPLSAETQQLRATTAPLTDAPTLNRLLLEDAYPLALADAALAFGDGALALSRCTVMGRVVAHRLEASECILQELTQVDDLQDGCVRFSAWASGSQLPRQYESVSVAQSAPLFTSTNFGQPGYAQLLQTADQQRLSATSAGTTPQNTISAGATDGSEMGAYARDKNPIRAQALLLKLQEYMPASLVPVIIDVT